MLVKEPDLYWGDHFRSHVLRRPLPSPPCLRRNASCRQALREKEIRGIFDKHCKCC